MTARQLCPRPLALAALVAIATSIAGEPLAADDRLLLKTSSGDPYLMILFDSSASMSWASTCEADDLAAGKCDFLCATENCPVPRAGDDPDSKFYLAKKALYDVLEDVEDVHMGFASLNQDTLAVGAKHWIYTVNNVVGENNPNHPEGITDILFAVGTEEVFGPIRSEPGALPEFDFGCDRFEPTTDNSAASAADYEVGCWPNDTDAVSVSTLDAWKLAKLHRLPKGGTDGTAAVSYYVSNKVGNTTTIYGVVLEGLTTAIDYATTTQFDVKVEVYTDCTESGGTVTCATNVPGNLKVTYERADDSSFFFWEHVLRKNNRDTDMTKVAYFGGFPDSRLPDDDDADGVAWATDTYATETCRGWDPSGTSYPSNASAAWPDDDPFDPVGFADYNLRFPDDGYTFDLTGTAWEDYQYLMLRGDVIPLDWQDTNKERVLERLSPAGDPLFVDGEPTFPEYLGQSHYFADSYVSGESFLRLKNESQRPLISHGLTPLAGWFSFFRSWYSGCGKPGNCEGIGWGDIAASYDPDFACRKKYVLMITDGGETCDGSTQLDAEDYYDDNEDAFPPGFEKGQNADQCRYRASLKGQEDVDTLVLGFGVENRNKLQCANTPVVFVENYEELKLAIEEFIEKIQEESSSFASAAVPTVQANIADKIYLSSFTPLNDASVWPGRLDSFLKPLPLDGNKMPNRAAACDPFDPDDEQSACLAWDAGDSQSAWNDEGGYSPAGLLLQAPLESEITRFDESTLKLGNGDDERRVFYGLPDNSSSAILGNRAYFTYPEEKDDVATDIEQTNYEYAWNLTVSATGSPEATANREVIADVVEFTLREKQAEIDNPDDADAPLHVQYVLGDIFHSNPLIINPPDSFDFYTKNLYWGQELCGESVDATRSRGPQISYSWFANRNLCRRIMAVVGSNDGQLHAFDAGVFEGDDCKLNLPADAPDRNDSADDDGIEGEYNYGSGRELFSFIPNAMMPVVKELSEVTELTEQYGVDGNPRVADVFIDPLPTAGVPTCTDREWRTVLLTNYREGAPGIFALDITYPDSIDGDHVPQPIGGNASGYVPSCIEDLDGGSVPSGCDLPFPALKWEFRDLDENGLPADDDGNGFADLAESWSRPFVARIKVCDGACDEDHEPEDRFVAVFGGGVTSEPTNSASDVEGNWLYMVDIETGEAIYKRGGTADTDSPIIGSIPGDVTGVDDDADGIVDALYFGTTAGYVYKVALGEGPFSLGADGRIEDPAGDDGAYDPFQIFSTGGRPIYMEINAVYVPHERANALLFGTGNRWDLWEFTGVPGRFYAILDDGWEDSDRDGVIDLVCPSCSSPLTENQYQAIDPASAAATQNYLYGAVEDKLPGWYFTLQEDEKLITEPFTLSAVSFFTIFAPTLAERDNVCVFTGESKLFVVTAGYAIAAGTTDRTRYTIAPKFTTQPWREPSATKNAPAGMIDTSDAMTDELRMIYEDLKKLFPPGARFANYTINIKTSRSDTGIEFIAPLPVAIEPHTWKEY
jgi:hypothetical protein